MSASQSSSIPGFSCTPGCVALVTGSSGLCGARLVEMLLERGAKHVICFDLSLPEEVEQRFDAIQKKCLGKITTKSGKHGDVTSDVAVQAAFECDKIDVVYHIAALVGPFFDRDKYHAVNHYATKRIIQMCQIFKVPKLVYSSSPSTRFTGADVDGLTEDELPMPTKWLAMYAEAKAYGEMAVTDACSVVRDDPSRPFLLTCSVAPHQVYGPYDNLMLPNLLETAGNGRLRIFGSGLNRISVTYVDNYAHGLLCAADVMEPGAACLGKFYIVTDGPPVLFWEWINQAIVSMGFTDLYQKFHLPVWLLYIVAHAADVIGWLLGKKFKLNPFNVKMLTIHRYFLIDNAQRDLKYRPLKSTKEAWSETIAWFQKHWLPQYLARKGGDATDKKLK